MNQFDKSIFINILEKHGYVKAIEYKNLYIPNVLYKYFPLFDERYVNYEQENNKRLDSIKNNELWVSRYDKLNDPFEYKMFTFDKERLESKGWDIEKIEFFIEEYRLRFLTTSFSGETENNMPLWAHYANNHTGFCVKYRVKNPHIIYPVFYEPKRIRTTFIPTVIITELVKASENNHEPSKEFYKNCTYLNLSLCCKHELWEYENEYRLLYPEINILNDGKLVSLTEIGIEIDSIFVGYKTNNVNKRRLFEIAEKLNINIFEMYFDEYNEEFKLHSKNFVCVK